MTERAIQIASFDAARKLIFLKTALDIILNQPHLDGLLIAIYSFVGAYRTGKSFTLCMLERFLKSNIDLQTPNWLEQLNNSDEPLFDGFKWRGGSRGETQGIWVWSEVFVVDGPAGQKVGLLLMDTQGLFDRTNTEQQDGKIFTLSTLISSIQIFNMSKIMQEDKLANLHLFSEFGRRAMAIRNSSSTNSSSGASKAFQRIIFLIRDWQYPNDYPFGSEGGNPYIEDFFDISREMGGTDLAQRRQYIRGSFDQVDCYLMPHPGTRVANGDANFTGRLSEMEDDFKEHLEKFISFLFPRGMAQPKTMAGTHVLASDLSSYIEYYVDLLNSDQTLSAQSIFQATTTIHNSSVARNAIKEYKTSVTAVEGSTTVDTFMSVDNMKVQHEGFYRQALDFFTQHQMGDAEPNSPILDQLKKDLVTEFGNWERRNELIKAQIINFNEAAVREAEKMYSSTIEGWFNLNKANRAFLEMSELMGQHSRIKQSTTESLQRQLKGGADFFSSFIQRLHEDVETYFYSFIVSENESNRKHEEYRTEMSHRMTELTTKSADKEREIMANAATAIAKVKSEAEDLRIKYETELKAAKEVADARNEKKIERNDTKIAEIEKMMSDRKKAFEDESKRIKDETEKAVQKEREKKQKEMDKILAENAALEKKLKEEQDKKAKEKTGFWRGLGRGILKVLKVVAIAVATPAIIVAAPFAAPIILPVIDKLLD